jgi:hypothetical protein
MENSERIKYFKPENFGGRLAGHKNYKNYKWDIVYFDKENNEMKSGKFCTINDLNEKLGLNLTTCIVNRLITMKKVDTSKRNKENSFLSRFGHIKLSKIKIPVDSE